MKKNRAILIITICLLAIATYLIISQRQGTIRKELRDFAIQDTASVTKIFLADKFGNESTVTKLAPGKWIVNGKYPARNDAINMLLMTMKNMEIRSPVAKAGYNSVMKIIAAKGIKVEVYQENKLIKTLYVGHATQDMMGTFMYLENSSVPFVLHIPGFEGYLTTRFITQESEWKMRTVFNYKEDEIKTVISENFEDPQQSFMISKQGNDEFQMVLYPGKNTVPFVEQNKIMDYLSGFTFINYENVTRLLQHRIDSIRNSKPFRALTVTDTKDQSRRIRFFHLPVTERSKQYTSFGVDSIHDYDLDRLAALIDNDTTLLNVQYYVFIKLFRTPADFTNIRTYQAPKKQ